MKKYIILLMIFYVCSSEEHTQSISLQKKLPTNLHHLGDYVLETSVVIDFMIKLEDQLQGIRSFLKKYSSEENIDESALSTIVEELEKELSTTKALFKERFNKDKIDPAKVSNLIKKLKEELEGLTGIFDKRFRGDDVQPHEITDFRAKFIEQHQKLINFLKKFDVENYDTPKAKEFDETYTKLFSDLEKVLKLHSNKKILVQPEVAEFVQKLGEKIDELIVFLANNLKSDHSDLSKVTKYGLEVWEKLKNILDLLFESLTVDLKNRPELTEIQAEFDDKLGGLVVFLEEHSFNKNIPLSVQADGHHKLEEQLDKNLVTSSTLSSPSFQGPTASPDHLVTQTPQTDSRISFMEPLTKIDLSELNESAVQLQQDDPHHQPDMVVLKTTSRENLNKPPAIINLKNPIETHQSDIENTSSIQQKEIHKPAQTANGSILETHLRPAYNNSFIRLPTDDLFAKTNSTNLQLESENLQNNTMNASMNFLKEKDLQISLTDTEKKDVIEIRENGSIDHMLLGDDPKFVENSGLSENEQSDIQDEITRLVRKTQEKIDLKKPKTGEKGGGKKLKKTNRGISKKSKHIKKGDLENNKHLGGLKKVKNNVKGIQGQEKIAAGTTKIIQISKHDSLEPVFDHLRDDPNVYSRENKYDKDLQSNSGFKVKKIIFPEEHQRPKTLNHIQTSYNHKRSISKDDWDNLKVIHTNGNKSMDENLKAVVGKPRNSPWNNNSLNVESQPHLNELESHLTLNFTISRRVYKVK